MNRVRKLLRTDVFWERGILGYGVTVAVLDTGIWPHEDFKNRLIAWYDGVHHRHVPYDDSGHGTHVAGIIGGDGKMSGGKYAGMAPGCRLIGVKVLDRNGKGSIAQLIRGLSWVLENRERYDIRIVNISVGTVGNSQSGEDSALVRKVDELWDQGIIVVTSAGNEGPECGTVTSPGISRKTITVGCSDDDFPITIKGIRIKNYSGRGPTKACVVKPEIYAPGSRIISCSGNRDRKHVPYTEKSGTSMATPIVSGAIALLLQGKPELTNKEVKYLLWESCEKSGETPGWGLLRLDRLLIP